MKKLLFLMTIFVLILAGCSQKNEANDKEKAQENDQEEVTLKVASLIPPMTEILELIKPKLAEESIKLEIVVLGDNVQPNSALAADEVDANFFQHVPYMEEFNRNNDADLVPIVPIYFANYGTYSKEYNSMDELPEEAVIAIANDVSNIDRSLALLAQHDVITLKEKTGPYYTKADIVENPKTISLKK